MSKIIILFSFHHKLYARILSLFTREVRLRFHTILFCSVLFAFAFSAYGQQPEAKILTMDAAVNMAINNHPDSKNSALAVDAARAGKSGSFQFEATDITWEYGQLYSPIKDNRVEIRQNFGSPLTHYQLGRYYKNELDLRESEQKITRKILTSKVKEAYFRWVHQISVIEIFQLEGQLYQEFLRKAQIHYEFDESNLLEKTMAEVRFAESQRKLFIAQEQLKIAVNLLRRYIYSEEEYKPSQTELELYSIKFPIGTTDKFDPYTFRDYYEQQANRKKIELSLEKSKLYPEISAGYFIQDIHPDKNLQGFQIGISVPVLFFSQTTRIKEAGIKNEIAVNEAAKQTFELQGAVDDLKIKLDQQFINVVYFKETALQQADLLIKTAALKLEEDEIAYTDYMQSIAEAMKIKEAYLNTLLNYNLTALELECMLN